MSGPSAKLSLISTTIWPTTAWRLCRLPHADLSGGGARRHGGRWNTPGKAAIYFSQDAALPVLETLVHLDIPPELLPDDYILMWIDLAEFETLEGGLENGPANPLSETDSRDFGDQWIMENRSLILRVPSVIVPESINLVLNPAHPLAGKLRLPKTRPFAYDDRLFSFGD